MKKIKWSLIFGFLATFSINLTLLFFVAFEFFKLEFDFILLAFTVVIAMNYYRYRCKSDTENLRFSFLGGDILAALILIGIFWLGYEKTSLSTIPITLCLVFLGYEVYRKLNGYAFFLPDRWFKSH